MTYDKIPDELKKKPRWVCWVDDKTPINAISLRGASSTDPGTWTTFDNAVKSIGKTATYMYEIKEQDGSKRKIQKQDTVRGVGFILGDGYAGADLDNHNGTLDSKLIDEFMAEMPSYTELSKSGEGIHIIGRCSKQFKGCRKDGTPIEMYTKSRYFIMTGNAITSQGINDITEGFEKLHTKYIARHKELREKSTQAHSGRIFDVGLHDDGTLIGKAKRAKNGREFEALFSGDTSGYGGDHSAADQALCNRLAFWTKKDAEQMDRIFRQSGLMREKWDVVHGSDGRTYGQMTIDKANEDCTKTYDPRDQARQKAQKYITIVGGEMKTLADLQPDKSDRYGWNDIGNGYLFADWFKDKARYVPQRKKWFIYDGRIWREDAGNLQAMKLCKKLADELMIYALSIQNDEERLKYVGFVGKWQKRSYRETILKDAVDFAKFDHDPYLFNCINGTLNLETGEFYTHRPGDLITKLAGAKYDPQAVSEQWIQFMDQVMQEDPEKTKFLQKAFGYGLTGSIEQECFFTLFGETTRNGKGTTVGTYLKMLGDYGKTAMPDTISQKYKANGSGPSEDIARLAGARVVNISEPDQNMNLNAALVKTLTGGDPITARHLNENSFEFKPSFKIFINTNHLPKISDLSVFKSGRVKVIPFGRHFGEDEQDKQLKQKLTTSKNLSGLLNWCITGLKLLRQEGLNPPESVRVATENYQEDSDKVGRFMADELEMNFMEEVKTSAVYERYQEWCSRNGVRYETSSWLNAELKKVAEINRRRPRAGGDKTTLLIGYRLKPHFGAGRGNSL